MTTQAELEKLQQILTDLMFTRNEVLVEKIEKLGESIDKKLQSLEYNFIILYNMLDKIVLTFLQNQDEYHKKLLQLTNEKRMGNLENDSRKYI